MLSLQVIVPVPEHAADAGDAKIPIPATKAAANKVLRRKTLPLSKNCGSIDLHLGEQVLVVKNIPNPWLMVLNRRRINR